MKTLMYYFSEITQNLSTNKYELCVPQLHYPAILQN